MSPLPYNDFGSWIRRQFPFRVQKLSIDAGFSCPNRDGRISTGGCSFCDNETFNPSYCDRTKPVATQIAEGKAFFARKYPDMRYLAYFQAYTNTYAPLDKLKALYEEALVQPGVEGIVIGTRPDCVSTSLLDYLEQLAKERFVMVEYGIESANDLTLARINRGHDFACSRRAVELTAERGIMTGGHMIIGLPGEGHDEIVRQASLVSSLPLTVLKLHQLQIIRGTRLAKEYSEHPFPVFSVDEYIHTVCDYVERLRPDLVLERFVSQSPAQLLIAPKWGLKNHEFTDRLVNHMRQNGIRQGSRYQQE